MHRALAILLLLGGGSCARPLAPPPAPVTRVETPSDSQPAPSAPPVAPKANPAPSADVEPPPEQPPQRYTVELTQPLGPEHLTVSKNPPKGLPDVVELGRYMNARYAFALDVPFFLEPDPPPMSGDGRVFRHADLFELRVFGSGHHGDPMPTTRDPGHRAHPDVTSSISKKREGDRVHFTKLVFADGIEVYVMAEVDVAYEAYFAPIIERAFRSLRVTVGGQYDRPERPSQPY